VNSPNINCHQYDRRFERKNARVDPQIDDERFIANPWVSSSWLHMDQIRNNRWKHLGHDVVMVIDQPLSLGFKSKPVHSFSCSCLYLPPSFQDGQGNTEWSRVYGRRERFIRRERAEGAEWRSSSLACCFGRIHLHVLHPGLHRLIRVIPGCDVQYTC